MARSNLLSRRVYRALLRSAKPFTAPSPNASVLSCLLYRSHSPLLDKAMDKDTPPNKSDDSTNSTVDEHREKLVRKLFSRLLRDTFTVDSNPTGGDSESSTHVPLMRFPSHFDAHPSQLRDVIRREFRVRSVPQDTTTTDEAAFTTDKPPKSISAPFDISVREQVAFLALRKLNEKLSWAHNLELRQPSSINPCPQQAALHISPLFRSTPPISMSRMELSHALQPGTFLLAHPLMTGFFHRTVICILHRKQHNKNTSAAPTKMSPEYEEEYGTYGLVINRISTHDVTGQHRTLYDVCGAQLPTELRAAFGSSVAKHGGPVHMPSIQMVHSCVPEQDTHAEIGGTLLSPSSSSVEEDEIEQLVGGDGGDGTVPAEDQRAVYYQGDLRMAAKAVVHGHLDRDDVSFFFGASVWSEGQLEDEIEKGWWLPCNGPSEILVSGVCEHGPTENSAPRPKADLWLSMMSACGEGEAELAHLLLGATEEDIDGTDSYGNPCDYF